MQKNMKGWGLAASLLASLWGAPTLALVQNAPPVSYGIEADTFHPVRAQQGMVASVDATATQVGVDILRQGGNAVDAAVAVGFALAVTHPQAGNLGGGGFMLLRTAAGRTTAIDFREIAPSRASRDMFLDKQGNADSKLSLTSPLASGTPGTVAGFALAAQKYGTLPLSRLLQPAIKLAQEGIVVNDALADDLNTYGKEVLLSHDNSRAIFFKPDGAPYQKGERLVQKNLAHSLSLIAQQGPDAFYKGAIADEIAAEMAGNGGLIGKADLANYRAIERQPIGGSYRGYQVFSMPPPSSGGIHIVQILNILENFDLAKMGFGSADAIQVMAEAEKYAYADRSEYLGDPDFVKVPWQALTSKAYAKSLAQQIDVAKARPSDQIKPGKLEPYESNQTTHFSVVDKQGNAVAVTYTLNTNFGSGIVAGKSGIITTVLQMVVNSIDFGMNVAEATSAPRFHHQWLPDQLRVEKGFSPDTLKLLSAKGQNVEVLPAMGSTQSIMIGPDGTLYGASDPRTVDDLTAGY